MNKKGLAPIEISIIINGKRCFIQLPRKEYPSSFKKAVESKRNNQIKEYLEEIRLKLNDIQLDLLKNNIPLTADSLKDYFKTGGIKTYTVKDLFDEYFQLLEKRVGVNLTYPAFKKYKDSARCFYKYVEPTKELITVTPSIIENFKADIDKLYKPSTVNGIMTKIKTVFLYGKDNGKISINPFANIKCNKIKNKIEYLTEEELEKLYDLELDNKSLSDVRDAFILQASTGLAYCDVYNLKKEDIQIDDDGTHYIIKNRQKTNTQFVTIVLDKGVEVLKKHNYQLHIISNQKYNHYLKIIQGLTDIETHLTTHLARKSFATYCLNSGIRIETVAKMLGHKNIKISSEYYCQLHQKRVIEEAKKAVS